MTETIDIMKGAVETLLKMPTILLLWPAMNVVGWLLKRSTFPNRFIPLVVVTLPAPLVCFVLPFNPGDMSPFIHPGMEHVIRCFGIGLVLGFMAWGTHRVFPALCKKWVPGFDDSDTATIYKLPPQ